MNKKTYVSPEVRSYELRTAGGLASVSGKMQSYSKQEKQIWIDSED